MSPLGAFAPLTDLGRSVREGFFMFWETLWPLVLGFGLSGAVQAFVSRQDMERVMGDHRPKAVARATGIGMVSSSCSYAATAMAKSLFTKGADFVTAMVFMFASTNLVIELGIVLVILLGWQFAAAEFIGGPIMIVLLAITGGIVLHRRLTDPSRERLRAGVMAGGHDHQAMVGVSEERQSELERQPWSKKLRSRAAWADAASYTMADLTMLRKELLVGYLIAGFLTILVPTHLWNSVFLRGHGFWTSLENVLIGPFIAFISFVCSVGNVPMAAALWKGGISFGGVISFIFADLIAFPLVLIYRKYYGTRLALRLFVYFWAVMATAGLAVEGIFALLRLIPRTRPVQIVATHFQWNYTTFLNLGFLVVFAYLYWLYRNRERLGGGKGYALDPVCGMQVRTAEAPAHLRHEGTDYWFCSDRCAERFSSDPRRSGTEAGPPSTEMAGSPDP
ncbi:MAG: permease [Acidimicrobiales bacterium]